jgi:hypothetical protein
VLKKTITFEDFNGETVTEDYFFHLSKAELIEMELSHEGGLEESLKRIIAANDNKALVAEFKALILASYGEKSEDGRRFIKNQELREGFESSEAYSTLFMELATDAQAAVEFINGMIPKGLVEEAEKLAAQAQQGERPSLKALAGESEEPEVVSGAAIREMDAIQLREFGIRLQEGKVVIGD